MRILSYYLLFFTNGNSSFFILHSSLNFAKQNSFGRAASLTSFARVGLSATSPAPPLAVAGGSATIPLANRTFGASGFAAPTKKLKIVRYFFLKVSRFE